jgi:hypothetical protein
MSHEAGVRNTDAGHRGARNGNSITWESNSKRGQRQAQMILQD